MAMGVMSPAATAALSSTSDSWSTSTDTERIILSPAFLEALRAVVPRRRRAKVPYIIAAGLLVVLVVVGADRSTREFVSVRWRGSPALGATAVLGATQAPQASDVAGAAGIAVPTATTDKPVDPPVAVVASSPPAASASERGAAPRKARARGPKRNGPAP
jgi:hypothetical protein